MQQLIRVLVVDDSAFMRHGIRRLLQQDAYIKVIGEAENGLQGIAQVHNLRPDVVIMDVEMPGISGIESVRRIMEEHPLPILMFSSLTRAGAISTIHSLAAGALDFLTKESNGDIFGTGARLRAKVRMLAKIQVSNNTLTPSFAEPGAWPSALDASICPSLVVLGASTGGPKVLQEMLTQLPATIPYPIVVVQHMPGQFTRAFAQRLNQMSQTVVKEAAAGDITVPGHIYIAPGGLQISLQRCAEQYLIQVTAPRPDELFKPSVDACFSSLASMSCESILAIVLTGMGSDGAVGARRLFQKGATVWTQNAASCVVSGMPNAVLATGISALSLTPDAMLNGLLSGERKAVTWA